MFADGYRGVIPEGLFKKDLFIYFYLLMAVLGLHFCVQASSSCRKQELLSLVCGLRIAVASRAAEHAL